VAPAREGPERHHSDHAAQLLADAEAEEATIEEAVEIISEEPVVVAEEAVAPVAEAEPGTSLEAQVEVGAAAEATGAQAEVIERVSTRSSSKSWIWPTSMRRRCGGRGQGRQGKKTAKGQRELVYDDRLGQVVSRKKRKPGRQGWEDDIESY